MFKKQKIFLIVLLFLLFSPITAFAQRRYVRYQPCYQPFRTYQPYYRSYRRSYYSAREARRFRSSRIGRSISIAAARQREYEARQMRKKLYQDKIRYDFMIMSSRNRNVERYVGRSSVGSSVERERYRDDMRLQYQIDELKRRVRDLEELKKGEN